MYISFTKFNFTINSYLNKLLMHNVRSEVSKINAYFVHSVIILFIKLICSWKNNNVFTYTYTASLSMYRNFFVIFFFLLSDHIKVSLNVRFLNDR